jgi:hypothetical protein
MPPKAARPTSGSANSFLYRQAEHEASRHRRGPTIIATHNDKIADCNPRADFQHPTALRAAFTTTPSISVIAIFQSWQARVARAMTFSLNQSNVAVRAH